MLRLSELYTSIQGEGPRTGTLTQFVRFAGCNMRCPGWPCDTPFAIDPAIWRTESEKVGWAELSTRVMKEYRSTGVRNVCFTGGEPFMQDCDELALVVDELRHLEPAMSFEFFTNGSFEIPHWALYSQNILINLDWKLQGSGEALTAFDVRMANARRLRNWHTIKFVCKDEGDMYQALGRATDLKHADVEAEFWMGAVWGTLTEADIVEFIKQHTVPFKLNVQVHKYVFGADERRT